MKKIYLLCLISFISCFEGIDFHSYILNMTNKINKYRIAHQASELKYNENLSKIANKSGKRIFEEMNFLYSNSTYNGKILGENFFYCNTLDSKSCLNSYDIPKFWYEEYYKFCFNTKVFNTTSNRNFITMIWKESTSIGCSIIYKRFFGQIDSYLVVCEFYPGPHPSLGASYEQITMNIIDRDDNDKMKNLYPC